MCVETYTHKHADTNTKTAEMIKILQKKNWKPNEGFTN